MCIQGNDNYANVNECFGNFFSYFVLTQSTKSQGCVRLFAKNFTLEARNLRNSLRSNSVDF